MYGANHVCIGVNDTKPTVSPAKGYYWVRMKGGPLDGQWVQVKK